MSQFSHFSRKCYYEMMFFNAFSPPFAMFVCPSGLDSECRQNTCPVSPQISGMLSAPEEPHNCHIPDGNKRQLEYFNTQERHGCCALSSSSSSQTVAPEKVTLVVDGTRFAVNPQIFTAHPDTMLGRWVTSVTFKRL